MHEIILFKTGVTVNDTYIPVKVVQNGVEVLFVEYKAIAKAVNMPVEKLRNFYNHCKKEGVKTFLNASNVRFYELDGIINTTLTKPKFFVKYELNTAIFTQVKTEIQGKKSDWKSDVLLPQITQALQPPTPKTESATVPVTKVTGVNLQEHHQVKDTLHQLQEKYVQLELAKADVKKENNQLIDKIETLNEIIDNLQQTAEQESLANKRVVQVVEKQLKAAHQKVKELQATNLSLQEENIDLQLGMKQGASPIEKMVTSRAFEMAFIWSLIGATFLGAFTKFLGNLIGEAYYITDVMAGLTYAIISLALAFGVVWFSFNKSDKDWVNVLVLGVLFLCEWVSFSKFTGMDTGFTMIDTGRDWIFSIFLPTMTLLLAKLQSQKALRVELSDMVQLTKTVLMANHIQNTHQIIVDIKDKVLHTK